MEPASSTEELQKDVVEPVGCRHYQRKLKFVTPCCDKIYTCRFCHDDKETHVVNRKEITEVVCAICDTRQLVRPECQQCETKFGKYMCLECNLFDDILKGQFHCDGCGICRVGGADNYFHCEKCNLCLPMRCQNGHKCVENVSRANCPICLEDIHTSRIPAHVPKCGHLLHRTCYEDLLLNNHYSCPICQVSIRDMTTAWRYLDTEIANTPMPSEYLHKKIDILCRDCHQNSTVPFHIIALKCIPCGSYNTCGTNRSIGELIFGRTQNVQNNDHSSDADENFGFRIPLDENIDQNCD